MPGLCLPVSLALFSEEKRTGRDRGTDSPEKWAELLWSVGCTCHRELHHE